MPLLGTVPVLLDPRLGRALTAQVGDRVGEVIHRYGLDPRERGLGAGSRSAENAREAGPQRSLGESEHAADRP